MINLLKIEFYWDCQSFIYSPFVAQHCKFYIERRSAVNGSPLLNPSIKKTFIYRAEERNNWPIARKIQVWPNGSWREFSMQSGSCSIFLIAFNRSVKLDFNLTIMVVARCITSRRICRGLRPPLRIIGYLCEASSLFTTLRPFDRNW